MSGTVTIEHGKVDGKPIIKAWESFTGWYWFATEHVERDIYFGFVVGTCPEWGYFSARDSPSWPPAFGKSGAAISPTWTRS